MFALNVYPNKFVHTIIIWNVQFHLASFYLMASLLTLTEADIYLAGSLLPEILLTVQILSTQLQILSTQSTKYRQMSSNIDKCQQISTNIDFNVIFPGFLTEFQGFSRISRIFLNSRVFPGFPGFPGSVDTLVKTASSSAAYQRQSWSSNLWKLDILTDHHHHHHHFNVHLFQDQSRVWTAASQQQDVDNQPLAFSLNAVVYPWESWNLRH